MSLSPVTICHTESSRGWGGQEIRIHSEMLAMRKRGHSVFLACPPDATIASRAAADGIQVIPFSDAKAAYPASLVKLTRLFKATGVCVVNPHSSRDGWLAGLAARLAGVQCIVRSRHIEVDYPNAILSRLAFHRLPHHVLTTSQRISERLISELRLDPRRVTCIPTGIDLGRFHPGAVPSLGSDPRIPPRRLLIGMIAVLRSWKGHDDFLSAARILADSGAPVHFIVAGDGPGKNSLLRGIGSRGLQEKVTWIGHRDDVPNIIASLDVLVLPSYAHEGIPQIILQAQACGKAVVGTSIGGIPEVIQQGETGLLTAPRDPVQLASSLSRLISDSSLRQSLGSRALEFATRQHGQDLMCERLEAIYQKYLRPRS